MSSESNEYQERLKQRRLNDRRAIEDAVAQIAGAVCGKSLADALGGEDEIAESAIAAILSFYHSKPVDIPSDVTGIEARMDYAFRPAGIMRRNVELSKGWYKDAVGAFLAVRKDNGNVVALIPSRGRYVFHDTQTGKDIVVDAGNEGLFEKNALCFYEPLPQGSLGLPDLIRFFTHTLRAYSVLNVLIVMVLGTLTSALVPGLVKALMSRAVGDVSIFISVATFMVAATISGALIGALRTLLTGCMQREGQTAVQAALMMRVLNMPVSFFGQFGAGDLSYRIASMDTLWSAFTTVVFGSGITLIMAVVYILQLLAFGGDLVIPAVCIMAGISGLIFVQVISGSVYSKKMSEVQSKRSATELALISGVQKIKLSGSEGFAFAKWGERFSESLRLRYNKPFFLKYGSVLVSAVSLFGTILLYWCAKSSGITLPQFYAFMTAFGLASGAFTQFAGLASTIVDAHTAQKLLQPILEAEPETSDTRRSLPEIQGGIEVSHVSFRYSPDGPFILNDLSLKIEPGEYVAIVGRTGCGKSTLMRVLLGFERPEKGGVFFDGHDIAGLDASALRRNVGVVMQNAHMLQGDIYSNIVISNPDATMADAWEAAEAACIADDIRAMPMGMSTLLTNGGGGISGGQRQRLAIARAIVGKPRVLLFDEATSALDNVSQKKVSEALDKMGCTRIVIAHRLSTIKQCNRVVVLDGGRIVADGTFDEVYEEYLKE